MLENENAFRGLVQIPVGMGKLGRSRYISSSSYSTMALSVWPWLPL